jgi:hypothetical protein
MSPSAQEEVAGLAVGVEGSRLGGSPVPSCGEEPDVAVRALSAHEEVGALAVGVHGRRAGVGDVAVVAEEEQVCGGAAAADEQVRVLAVQSDSLLAQVIVDVKGTALPGRAEGDRRLAAAQENRRYTLSVVDGDLAPRPGCPELDVPAAGVELDDGLPGLVKDRDRCGLDLDPIGSRVVLDRHGTDVASATGKHRGSIAVEHDCGDPVVLGLHFHASRKLLCHIVPNLERSTPMAPPRPAAPTRGGPGRRRPARRHRDTSWF